MYNKFIKKHWFVSNLFLLTSLIFIVAISINLPDYFTWKRLALNNYQEIDFNQTEKIVISIDRDLSNYRYAIDNPIGYFDKKNKKISFNWSVVEKKIIRLLMKV